MFAHHPLVKTLALVYLVGFVIFLPLIRSEFSKRDMTWGGVVSMSLIWPLWVVVMLGSH